jgi:hypothetical protein
MAAILIEGRVVNMTNGLISILVALGPCHVKILLSKLNGGSITSRRSVFSKCFLLPHFVIP